jgi:protein-tyrosine phosphatase
VRHVIDISHGVDAAYDPTSFLNTPITYHKFPTAAKIPPTEQDVAGFITLVKGCLQTSRENGDKEAEICVHCHYGFNRTGFMICSWLIEAEGYGVKEALEAFKSARPNGIRHVRMVPLPRIFIDVRFHCNIASEISGSVDGEISW